MFKKKKNTMSLGQVIIPTGHPNPPELHEVEAAYILSRYFKCSIEFLIPVDDYKRGTADIVMLGAIWEIKSPIGNSKTTISNQFKTASRQARNIIIDARRTALDFKRVEKESTKEFRMRLKTKRVILIDKSEKVVELSK